MNDCIGCKLAHHIMDTFTIYEDDDLSCILDIDPIHDGHMIILPKQHIETMMELNEELSSKIMNISIQLAKALEAIYNPDGVTILQNNGIFNDLNHYHMHVFPRYKDDGFGWVEPQHDDRQPLHLVRERIINNLKLG